MRAELRRKNHTIGSKWLRQGGAIPAAAPTNSGGKVDKEGVTSDNAGGRISSTRSGILKDKQELLKQIELGENHGNNMQPNTTVIISNQRGTRENNIQVPNSGLDTENVGLIVTDPKRKRTEEHSQNGPSKNKLTEDENMVEANTTENSVSKNMIGAGSAG
ncbi:hypothetical protein POM88_037057 [Heracleum sosnowskyi]|uniref:Uncharacterized protein n=1 Tax=Heracleum sosnowskyi TaxID=360622 RepID=A0AAD8MCZ4_9APIA|nr:hypothetical protein POM88_037057 [Heracleum sosnowskyi]